MHFRAIIPADEGELLLKNVADPDPGFPAAVLAKIGDDKLKAWVVVDDESLSASARTLDALDPGQRAARPLYGVPVAIKDNFDTEDLPTEYGSPIYSGHQPAADAAAVQKLREAGALIVGKVKLAEFAWMHPPDTISPIDPDSTPGGSSTGSAVAVAARHVPVAIGTQTAGSVNRPASYCGVVGYKPTRGLIDTTGIKPNSKPRDTVGGVLADRRRRAAHRPGADDQPNNARWSRRRAGRVRSHPCVGSGRIGGPPA